MDISKSINENAHNLRELFSGTADLILKTMKLDSNGEQKNILISCMEGLVDKELITVCITNRIADISLNVCGDVFTAVRDKIVTCTDISVIYNLEDSASLIMSGFACIFIESCEIALAVGVQGFASRSIDEPQTEVLQRGSREGFSEPLKLNQSMIRRRLKNPNLKFENLKIGKLSNTDVTICYLRGVADEKIVDSLKNKLSCVDLDNVVSSGSLVKYLDSQEFSFFNGVGVTERPDTACAKICKGKIAVIADGSPSVIIVPHIMSENFSTLDDYSNRPYFASAIKLLKYTSFMISVFLPGLYVALASYDPELFPNRLLTRVTTSVSKTPFSIFAEVLLFTFIYEIMREAGLRLPKSLGHAVSIIGGLVIGDTAVSAGFIGAPTLMIVAVTVICSYVIPNLYAPISALRLICIIFGGIWGVWGITTAFCLIVLDLCSKKSFGEPFFELPSVPNFQKIKNMRESLRGASVN